MDIDFLLAFLLIVLALLLSRFKDLGLEKEIVIASFRALVQLMLLGSVIMFIFSYQGVALTLLALVVMAVAAAHTSMRRAEGLTNSFSVSLLSIALASFSIIFSMVFLGVLELEARVILPLGGMVIGNSMVTNSLALERLHSEVRSQTLPIEAALALGAPPGTAVKNLVRKSVRAALIPRLDSLTTLGLVWIPGLMAGMILGGSDPIKAAQYQLIIMFMILVSGMITVLISTRLLSTQYFNKAYQLREEFR